MNRRYVHLFLWALSFLAGAGVLTAGISDVTPPVLVEFDFNPKMIDVTAGPQTVTVTGRVTDDLAGAGGFTIRFTSPVNGQFRTGFAAFVSGGPLDGTYEGVVEIPPFVEGGTWKASVFMSDFAGNQSSLSDTNLADAGFPTDLDVTSTPDIAAPEVEDLTLTPSMIDVSAGDQIITIDLRLTDDVSGVDMSGLVSFFTATIASPTSQQRHLIAASDFTMISGSPTDGVWRASRSVPQYSEAGFWSIEQISFADSSGNTSFFSSADLTARGFTPTFEVVSAPEDTTMPQISGLTFTPNVINTSAGSQNVTVSMDLTDNLAGVDFSLDSPSGGFTHGLFFTSPSGGQSRGTCCNQFSLIGGTILNGTWQANAFFPQFSEAGTWKASLVQISDRTHNWLSLNATQLVDAGLSADLVIVRPSLVTDGSVGTGGGTVEDETFGSQAQITFPPGAVAGDTDVSIDVFESPLDIPTPTGFQGPGTNFVNVSLDPEPAGPFPAPGVTLVLPLAGPELLPVGFPISLFFVDPMTGALTPMLNFAGLPVVGTVDPGSLTATFMGISHFTIVVGLISDVVVLTPEAQVEALISAVQGLVDDGTLRSRYGQSLTRILQAALRQIEEDREFVGVLLIKGFIAEVKILMRFRQLPADDGQALIEQAESIITALKAL